MSSSEALAPAEQRTIFPISSEEIANAFITVSEFNEEDIRTLLDLNAGAGHDDPIEFLLDFGVRPEMRTEESKSARDAYSYGVLIGGIIVRGRVNNLQEVDPEFELPSFNADIASEIYWTKPVRRFPGQILNDAHGLALARNLQVYDFSTYLADPEAIAMLAHVKASGILQEFSFLGSEDIKHAADDYLNLGIRDTFRLYGAIANEQMVRQTDNLYFDPNKHTIRTSLRAKLPDDITELTAMHFEIEGSDLENPEQVVELLRGRRIQAGYKGVHQKISGPYTNLKGERGHQIIEIPLELDWNSAVPYNTRITNIHRFLSANVLHKPGENKVEEVALRETVQEHPLRRGDTVIVRGREGAFFALPHPFYVHPLIVDEKRYSVDLIALYTGSQTFPLVDNDRIDPDSRIHLNALFESLRKDQAEKRGWLGRLLLSRDEKKDYLWYSGAAFATAAAEVGVSPLIAGITSFLAAGVTALGMKKATKMIPLSPVITTLDKSTHDIHSGDTIEANESTT